MKRLSNFLKRMVKTYINENKMLKYGDVMGKQKKGNPTSDLLFSNETSEFIEETINIEELRKLNNLSNDINS
jgi:hypothetical protein